MASFPRRGSPQRLVVGRRRHIGRYVFVHLLPELQSGQEAVSEGLPGLTFLEDHVYVMALVGLGLFYWVELASRGASGPRGTARFWFSIGSFAAYSAT